MIITADYIADITLFEEFDANGKARNYLKRHNWKLVESGCGGRNSYDGKRVFSYGRFKKRFSDLEIMKSELADINDAFNETKELKHFDDGLFISGW